MITSTFSHISPAYAAELLKLNIQNRPLSEAHVARLARKNAIP